MQNKTNLILTTTNNKSPLVKLRNHFIEAFLSMLLLEALIKLSEYIALHSLPAGTAFILLPQGMSKAHDFFEMGILLCVFGAFYSIAGLAVRPPLNHIFRIVMFLIFTGSILFIRTQAAIAVVETPDAFIFIYRFPIPSETVTPKEDVRPEFSSKTMRSLTVNVSGNAHQPDRRLHCEYVYLDDTATTKIINDLYARLQLAVPH